MTEIIKTKIEKANLIILRNVFWLVPLLAISVAYIAIMGTIAMKNSNNNKTEIQKGVSQNVKNDSYLKKKMEDANKVLEFYKKNK